MLRRIEVRVALLLLSCLVVVLLNYFVVNHRSSTDTVRRRDKQTYVLTRRLLAVVHEDSDSTRQQQQRDANATTNTADTMQTDTLPEDLSYILNFTPGDDKQYRGDSGLLRRNGRIIVHVALACYCFWMLAVICDEYFIASIHIFCDKLKIRHELTAGTIVVMATSSPELFINCVSTFITEGDIGIGTIVGSTIFNVLVVTACCGFFARSAVRVDVSLLTRDCLCYALSIVGLIVVIYDRLIMWHEALLMVAAYFVYLAIIYSSDSMAKKMRLVAQNIKIEFLKVSYYAQNIVDASGTAEPDAAATEITPLFMRCEALGSHKSDCSNRTHKVEAVKLSREYDKFDHADECATGPWKRPRDSNICVYIARWPITLILWCTIPDCRRHGSFYVLTFINCVAWILALSYLIASLITTVDSIMGMIFLGGCTSMPDAVYSVIATMRGNADVGLSNAISANIYDILLCLGLPWSAKTLIVPVISGQPWITLNSTGITYSAISLLATLGILYLLFTINRFKLDKKFGVSCLLFYAIFLIFTLLLELNLLFPINFPAVVTINGLI